MFCFNQRYSGLKVEYAYGWIDLVSPSGVPYEVVVGIARDPLMLIALQTKNLTQSLEFYENVLGMKPLPFPLARQNNSEYESRQPPGSVVLGYGPNSLVLLLVPYLNPSNWKDKNLSKLNPKLPPELNEPLTNQSSVLNALTVVYDDTLPVASAQFQSLPSIVRQLIAQDKKTSRKAPSSADIFSPDGVKIILTPFSVFQRESIKDMKL